FIAFLLALAAVGFLIYFIHHIASSIQASTMIHAITDETVEVIKTMFPHKIGEEGQSEADRQQQQQAKDGEGSLAGSQWHVIPALSYGYIQRIEKERLLKIACRRRITLRMELGVGEFAHQGQPLVTVCGSKPDQQLIREINRNYGIDAHRTVDQDPGFGIQQLVDIAAKGLSPGINDTTTATTAVDYLSEILCDLAVRRLEPSHYFEGPQLRVIAHSLSFESLFNGAFDRLVEYAQGNHAVMQHLLTALARLAEITSGPGRQEAVRKQAQALVQLARTIQNPSVQTEIEAQAQCVLNLCGSQSPKREHLTPLSKAA
ncbi:MAG TPA: DUF2254 domain-containing protein, partial [Clostridia bacterium]|nr:DUF2254 domain-containing protein [Clostridia bacterium]